MTESKLVSPNQILDAAKNYMLNGAEPEDYDDWILIVNFVAFNVPSDLAESICLIMKTLFNIPVSDMEIALIAAYQRVSKEKGEQFDRAWEQCPDCKGDWRVIGHQDHYDDD